MSALVVTDVSAVSGAGASVYTSYGVSREQDTSITPFETVLEQTSAATANPDTDQVEDSTENVAMKVVAAEGSGGSSTVSTSTKLDNIFRAAADKYDISYDFLVAIAKAESDFQYDCVSSAGAKGIMQLMPETAKANGVTDAFDPEQSIFAAAKILSGHLKNYNGDYTLAAAAYNAGGGAVKKYGGVPPYTETQNYVKKIAKYMKEGVKVPDKDAAVTKDYSAYENGTSTLGSSSSASSTDSTSSSTTYSTDSATSQTEAFDEGVKASEEDYSKIRVTVGR